MKTRILSNAVLVFVSSLMFLSSEVYSTTHTVNVMNFAFSPPNINISVGDTVKWVYVNGNHTTTNNGSTNTSRPPGAASWDNPINSFNNQFSYVVTVPGAYIYKCAFHSSMIGNITATSPVLNLNFTGMMEGFWNGVTLVSDTIRVLLYNSVSPYNLKDSAKVKLSTTGTGTLVFSNAQSGSYYISVRHRNSIDTWSMNPVAFTSGGTVNYDFTNSSNQAYGSNLTLKSGKYTFYSGDVNQDGSINLTDVLQVYNEATLFAAGYVVTDVNGDNITDLADVLIAQNNANNFVSVSRPL
jgi:plastocyanin